MEPPIPLVITRDSASVSVDIDAEVCCTAGSRTISASLLTPREARTGEVVRVGVELSAMVGGKRMRAYVGGEFHAGSGDVALFEVMHYDDVTGSGEHNEFLSQLGSPLVAGLPKDLANGALMGLLQSSRGGRIPAGVLQLDRAAYDVVDSSQKAFERSCALIVTVVEAWSHGNDFASGGVPRNADLR